MDCYARVGDAQVSRLCRGRLTYLLQPYLTGQAQIVFVVTVTQLKADVKKTVDTLDFAASCLRKIRVKPQVSSHFHHVKKTNS